MRLIDADAFDRFIASSEFDAAMNDACDEDRPFEATPIYYSAQSFREIMKLRPTIDAAPIRHAKWVADSDPEYGEPDEHGNARFFCSYCDCCDVHRAKLHVPYCWNCGSKMDKIIV